MDSKISKTGVARQNSHPPQKAHVRGVQNERVVDQRDEYTRRSCSYCGPSTTADECGRGGPDIQGRHESNPEERISGDARVSMGRELLGGWVFCRDGRKGRRRSGKEVHPPATRQPIDRLCHKAETPGFSPGSFHIDYWGDHSGES